MPHDTGHVHGVYYRHGMQSDPDLTTYCVRPSKTLGDRILTLRDLGDDDEMHMVDRVFISVLCGTTKIRGPLWTANLKKNKKT